MESGKRIQAALTTAFCPTPSFNRRIGTKFVQGQGHIEINAARNFWRLYSVEPPASRGIGKEIDLDGIISYPT